MNGPYELKAIVAEDDPSTRRLLGSLLTKWSFHVIECPDGATAWKEIESSEGPLLAVVDWMMPEMSGLELCERIRALGKVRTGYIYTVMLTGKVERTDMLQALKSGVDSFLTKPLNTEELRASTNTGRRILTAALRQQQLTVELEQKTQVLEELGRELDQKVRDRTRELEESTLKAEMASKFKSEFLANMSHEIRTPLNGIISYTDLLLESELGQQQKADLNVIKSSVHSLKQIINDILDLSKVEAGRLQIDYTTFSLSSLLADTVDVIELMLEEKELTLVVETEPHVPHLLIGDPGRISQILMNLLGNASKFCRPNGGIIVLFSGVADQNCFNLTISVADSGIGIPVERQQAVFEAFQQADGSTTRRYGGTGLGLTICKKLVELMDGSITLQSKPGIGTRFVVEIPCRIPESKNSQHSLKEDISVEQLWSEIDPLNIILAEDHVFNREGLVRLLASRGHRIITASNGQEVLEKLPTSQADLILMDIQMPEMGGDEATTLIRSSDFEYRDIPIIALTANALDCERERLLQLGMTYFVPKPIGQRELATALKNALNSEKHQIKRDT
jgi:signal transduction histidine kinase